MADNTAYLQDLINRRQAIPAGTYSVNGAVGLVPRDDRTLDLRGVTLQVIPTASASYRILKLDQRRGVTIWGGTIVGDRDTHLGSTGEAGMGIDIRRSAGITVKDTIVRDCWGDGIYVSIGCSDIRLEGVTSDNNRRQGLTITSVNGLTAVGCTFSNTHGTAPEFGIDMEPNANESISNVLVDSCTFQGNHGGGCTVSIPLKNAETAKLSNVVVQNCILDQNDVGLAATSCSGVVFKGNSISRSITWAIKMLSAHGIVAEGNSIRDCGTPGSTSLNYGIHCKYCSDIQIVGNTLVKATGLVIFSSYSLDTKILRNSVTGARLTTNRSDSAIITSDDVDTYCADNVVQNNLGYGLFRFNTNSRMVRNTSTGNTKGDRL